MQPAPLDISLYRGDDFGLMLRVYSGTFNSTTGLYVKGQPLPLTGWSGAAQIRANEDSTTVLGTFEVAIDVNQLTNPGRIYVSMTAAETALLTGGGIWDLQLIDDHGTVFTYLKGKVSITKDVTRP